MVEQRPFKPYGPFVTAYPRAVYGLTIKPFHVKRTPEVVQPKVKSLSLWRTLLRASVISLARPVHIINKDREKNADAPLVWRPLYIEQILTVGRNLVSQGDPVVDRKNGVQFVGLINPELVIYSGIILPALTNWLSARLGETKIGNWYSGVNHG